MLPRDERLLAELRTLRVGIDAMLRDVERYATSRVSPVACNGCAEAKPADALARCCDCHRLLCLACRAECFGVCRPQSDDPYAGFDGLGD